MIKNPYSSKAPLVAKDDTPSSPLFPLLKDQNKGIRVRLVGITSATKGALDNKVSVDIQMVTSANLTAMASGYVALKASLLTCIQSGALFLTAA